ncbi:MAG: hypothetical protein CMH57_07705 [Myxococcales bacterium]|nr:hypothetical protein [Myxococcales bacterium]
MSTHPLDEGLREASERAAEVRDRYRAATPTEDDYADFEAEGVLLGMFLGEVREVLAPLHVAGIAFPDADLPDELDALAERAEAFGLAVAVERLVKLSRSLRALLEARGRRERAPWLRQAWSEMQHLVTWLRMMRSECDLLQIEGNLVASYEGRVQRATRGGQRASMDVWPFGVTVTRDNLAMIYGSDVESGKPVLLKDTLAEVNALDPMRAPVISRLMQDAVVLHKALRGLIRLSDHPYQRAGRLWVFTPGFKTIARPIARPGDVKAPKLSELTVTEEGVRWAEGGGEPSSMDIGWLYVEPVWVDGAVALRSVEGREVPIVMTRALALSLLKLLLRDGDDRLQLRFVCLVQERELYALNTSTSMDGRVFPSLDTLLFREHRGAFTARVSPMCEAAPWELLRLALEVELGRLGALAEERLAATREQLTGLDVRGVDRVWLHTLASILVGASVNLERVALLVSDALRLAADPSGGDAELRERVLGRAEGEADRWGELLALGEEAADDGAVISTATLYRAMWLESLLGFDEERQRLSQAILAARFGGPLHDPSAAEICARALLMSAAGDPDEAIDEPLDDDDERVAGLRAALEFFEAHVADIQPDGRRVSAPEEAPLSLQALLAFCHTADLLERRVPGAGFTLRLDAIPLAIRCVTGLVELRFGDGAPERTPRGAAALWEALLTLNTSGLSALLVE